MRKIELSNGEYYHIYNRGVDKREVFEHEYDYLRFQLLLYLCNSEIIINLRDLFDQEGNLNSLFNLERNSNLVSIGAYCLMPNHFHLLVKQEKENGISQFMQRLGTAYTMYFNNKNERTGSLFQGTFKAKHANTDEYLKYLFAYIHLNPIKLIDPEWKETGIKNIAKAEKLLNEFKYSSFQEYVSLIRPQNNVINKKSFPEYFKNEIDFKNLLSDWLNFKDNFGN